MIERLPGPRERENERAVRYVAADQLRIGNRATDAVDGGAHRREADGDALRQRDRNGSQLRRNAAIGSGVQGNGGRAKARAVTEPNGRRVLESVAGVQRQSRCFRERTNRVMKQIPSGNALRLATSREKNGRGSGEVQATH